MVLALEVWFQFGQPKKIQSIIKSKTFIGLFYFSFIFNELIRNLNTTNNEHYKCASGFYVDLIKELSNKLHFTYEIYQVEDGRLGEPNKFGEWNGVIKDLISEKADLALTPITITSSRSNVVDFSVPFMETGISIPQ